MDQVPELVYDPDERAIYVIYDDDKTLLYTDASEGEYDVVAEIDALHDEAWKLTDSLLTTVEEQRKLLQQNQYFDRLRTLQKATVDQYEECLRLKKIATEGKSDVVEAQLPLVYKIEKFLKHFFRHIAVAQSLGFTQRLVFQYQATGDYVFAYGLVRNACSTLEYLGKLLESRTGSGTIDFSDKGVNFERVYGEIKDQGLETTFVEDEVVLIPPDNERMPFCDVELSEAEISWLWTRRNKIVHHCPVVVEEGMRSRMPNDLESAATLTKDEIRKCTKLASRTHVDSLGMFTKYSASYMKDVTTKLVEAWWHEQPTQPE